MAIDVFKEEVLNLKQAAQRLPNISRGKPPHVSTIWRWSLHGKKSPDGSIVRLETIRIGGTTCTSVEAMQRFFERLTGNMEVVTPPTLEEKEWKRRSQEAARRLKEEFGI